MRSAQPSRHCSLGDSRSWTDMVTNVTALSRVRLEEDMRALLQFGATPRHLLPGFVHESTHHWCFLLPVGFVLWYLQLRARRTAVLVRNNHGDTKVLLHRLLGDVVRYETARTALRPIAEGLALFAEFDALSGEASQVFSVPTELVGALFSGGLDAINFGGIHLPYEGTRRPLVEWRFTNECLRRKQAILGHPFSVSEGGYLPGYLAVRQLWLQMSSADHRLLNESDLFLMALRSFFYDDYELIGLLLDNSPVERATSEAILVHIATRLDAVARISASDVAEYERAVAANEAITPLSECIVFDEVRRRRGHQRAEAMLTELQEQDTESVDGLLRLLDAEILQRRDIINFGSLDIDVEIDHAGMCRVTKGDIVVHAGAALERAAAGAGPGSLHVMCSAMPGIKSRVVIVYRGDEQVAMFFGGPPDRNTALQRQFLQMKNPLTLQRATDEMQETLDSVLGWDGIADLVAEMRELVTSVTDVVFGAKALPGVSESKRAHAVAAMREDGLLPLLDWDRKLINGVATLSVGWSLRLRREQLAQRMRDQDTSLDDVLQSIARCHDQFGIPAVLGTGDALFCSV